MRYEIYYITLGKLANQGNDNISPDMVDDILKIRRLAKKHHRLCEYECNGVGYIRGIGLVDLSTDEGYVNDESLFSIECEKIEKKIKLIVDKWDGLTFESQGDPRGSTIKLAYKGNDITDVLI